MNRKIFTESALNAEINKQAKYLVLTDPNINSIPTQEMHEVARVITASFMLHEQPLRFLDLKGEMGKAVHRKYNKTPVRVYSVSPEDIEKQLVSIDAPQDVRVQMGIFDLVSLYTFSLVIRS
tara:strand:+ start:16 stop:381 length:366 start_codon:yes stop_codon:yes gene_type:complete